MANPLVSERLMTAEEFYLLPEPEEGGKLELIDGRVVYEMPANGQHGSLAGFLTAELLLFTRRHKLGRVVPEVGFILKRSPDSVRAPDVAFVSREAMGGANLPAEGWVPYPPTLAIEVISPSNLDKDVSLKVEQDLEAGVERVWVVRPSTRTVTVHRPDHTSRTLLPGSALVSEDAGFAVAGFELPLDVLFAEDE
jgi:Uma2 family endonuclease